MFHEKMFESIILNELKFKKYLHLDIDCTDSLFQKFTDKRAFYYSIALPSLGNLYFSNQFIFLHSAKCSDFEGLKNIILSGDGQNFEDEELLNYYINRENEEVNDNKQVNNKNDIRVNKFYTYYKI